jgi:hypothetical protein
MTQDARRIMLGRLIDDAGLFPPARKPMAQAVADHRAARAGDYEWMLGRFLCPVSRLGELQSAGADRGWRLGAIGDGSSWAEDLRRVAEYEGPGTIDAVELRRPGELEGVPDGVEVFVEGPASALDGRTGAKIRCGGLTPDAFPPDEAVAQFISECVRRGLRFKATAGLHHPFRTRDDDIGVLQHGFVNLLAATALPEMDMVAVIAEPDPSAFELSAAGLRWRERVAGPEELARARELFTAYGSCSFDEPVADLVAHGVLEKAPARA